MNASSVRSTTMITLWSREHAASNSRSRTGTVAMSRSPIGVSRCICPTRSLCTENVALMITLPRENGHGCGPSCRTVSTRSPRMSRTIFAPDPWRVKTGRDRRCGGVPGHANRTTSRGNTGEFCAYSRELSPTQVLRYVCQRGADPPGGGGEPLELCLAGDVLHGKVVPVVTRSKTRPCPFGCARLRPRCDRRTGLRRREGAAPEPPQPLQGETQAEEREVVAGLARGMVEREAFD